MFNPRMWWVIQFPWTIFQTNWGSRLLCRSYRRSSNSNRFNSQGAHRVSFAQCLTSTKGLQTSLIIEYWWNPHIPKWYNERIFFGQILVSEGHMLYIPKYDQVEKLCLVRYVILILYDTCFWAMRWKGKACLGRETFHGFHIHFWGMNTEFKISFNEIYFERQWALTALLDASRC